MGALISRLEQDPPSTPAAAFRRGVWLVGIPVGVAVVVGWVVERIRPRPIRVVATLYLLKSSFALRALLDAGRRTEMALDRDDLSGARSEVRSLVSRPTSDLDEPHLASAIVESLSENLADSYLAPMAWYAVAGLPGALAYRAINTADAMVGYHGIYEQLGKPAARIDDLANLLPARLTAAVLAAAAPTVGGSITKAWGGAVRDHVETESPNAGWPMATAAAAVGVWLEKPGAYRLGSDGRDPTTADARAARRLVLAAALLGTVVFVVIDHARRR